jgi:hypothetical protein
MRKVLILAVFLAAAVADARSQDTRMPGLRETETKAEIQVTAGSSNGSHLLEELKAEKTEVKLSDDADHAESAPRKPDEAEPVRNMRPVDYVRPDAKKRLDTYIRNVAGPIAITRYAATAGLLTLRNTPKEWGKKPDGYGKRFANVAAKSLIKNTTVYALDEMLKVDSTFYLSRDRSPAARLRNSIFSAVTARNRRGQRVIGIPQLAGSFLSEVMSSVVWYPSRYDQDHGLKGGAISIGINAGLNIFREFILKR